MVWVPGCQWRSSWAWARQICVFEKHDLWYPELGNKCTSGVPLESWHSHQGSQSSQRIGQRCSHKTCSGSCLHMRHEETTQFKLQNSEDHESESVWKLDSIYAQHLGRCTPGTHGRPGERQTNPTTCGEVWLWQNRSRWVWLRITKCHHARRHQTKDQIACSSTINASKGCCAQHGPITCCTDNSSRQSTQNDYKMMQCKSWCKFIATWHFMNSSQHVVMANRACKAARMVVIF